jgi:hypothetical protein
VLRAFFQEGLENSTKKGSRTDKMIELISLIKKIGMSLSH